MAPIRHNLKFENANFILTYSCSKYATFIIKFLPFLNIFQNEEVIGQKPFCYGVNWTKFSGNDVTPIILKMVISLVLDRFRR